MITDITINATAREGVGKNEARRLRAKGFIPAALYGEGQEPIAVAVSTKEIANILRSDAGHNTIFKVAVVGGNGSSEPTTVIIKDIQVDPVKGRLLHADLKRLSLTTTTRVSVAVEFEGEPVGVRMEGGILEVQMREIDVECLPADIPEQIKVDVSNLHIGGHVLVSDLIYDREKVKVIDVDEHQVIAGVLAPRLTDEAAATPGEGALAESGEPEVIKKGKTDEA